MQFPSLGLFLGVILFISSSLIAYGQPNNLRGKKRREKFQKELATGGNDGQLFKALQILYPLRFFNPAILNSGYDWRSPGVYSKEFADYSTSSKEYVKIARAQDQEDVWLYENWFYGIKNGIIVESGALDGLLFSTSYMFENFANWTAIHVGKMFLTCRLHRFHSLLEADPMNFYKLKFNRENAINVNGALCSESKLLHYSSLGVVPVRGFIEFMSPSFIKKWHGKIYNNKTSIDELPTVQCLPMKLLLHELHVKHIDIWILDVEVLKNLF